MTTLTTLSDGETYADVRLGETFIVSVDRSAHEDALTVRVFHPDEPETAIGEHCLDLSLDEENGETTVETHTRADPTPAAKEFSGSHSTDVSWTLRCPALDYRDAN